MEDSQESMYYMENAILSLLLNHNTSPLFITAESIMEQFNRTLCATSNFLMRREYKEDDKLLQLAHCNKCIFQQLLNDRKTTHT